MVDRRIGNMLSASEQDEFEDLSQYVPERTGKVEVVFFCAPCHRRYLQGGLTWEELVEGIRHATKVHRGWKCRYCARPAEAFPLLRRDRFPWPLRVHTIEDVREESQSVRWLVEAFPGTFEMNEAGGAETGGSGW